MLLLPLPDGPIRPRVSPTCKVKSKSLTTQSVCVLKPDLVSYPMLKPRISSAVSLLGGFVNSSVFGTLPSPKKSFNTGKGYGRPSFGGLQASSPFVYGCLGLLNTILATPVSTVFPLYKTTTLSEKLATTSKSCDINHKAQLFFLTKLLKRFRTVLSTCLSKAVVGSSAIISFGSRSMAIAITTR